MTSAERFVVVLITAPVGDCAGRIARAVVGERLAACVNVLPGCTSVYRWNDAIESEEEVLLLVKTTRARLRSLEQRVTELHPYDVPEFLAIDPDHVSASYARFILDAVGGSGPDGPRTD